MGPHVFETEAFLLVLPTTEYQRRVPVTIGTSLTDMAVDSLGPLDQSQLSTLWKTVLYHPLLEDRYRHINFRKVQSKLLNP